MLLNEARLVPSSYVCSSSKCESEPGLACYEGCWGKEVGGTYVKVGVKVNLNIRVAEEIFLLQRHHLGIIESFDIIYDVRGSRWSGRVVNDLDGVVENKIVGDGVIPI